MIWQELPFGWQMAFRQGWSAFDTYTIPIGAVVLNQKNELVASGQNMIFVEQSELSVLYGTSIAHAEINAIAQLKRAAHPHIRSYTLYSTTEPCLLCFGAIVMGNIRHFKYAARDRYAGAAHCHEHNAYVRSKKIKIEGPHAELAAVQTALATYYELEKNLPNQQQIIAQMAIDCPDGVRAGRELFAQERLRKIALRNGAVAEAFAAINEQLRWVNP